ncbi:hypothetical protein OF83DRAFT_1173990 [Amylostereum chailletii]|nr:hypothetical protein OF83DRAFT_1173990 [Amylostereum chailletii]
MSIYRLITMDGGSFSLSLDGTTIAVTNLYDGIDWYSVQRSKYGQPQQYTHNTLLSTSKDNIKVPILHVHSDSAVLVGPTIGSVCLIATESGRTLQSLDHGGSEKIQTLAYIEMVNKERRIATGVSEGGSQSVIRLWVAKDDHPMLTRKIHQENSRYLTVTWGPWASHPEPQVPSNVDIGQAGPLSGPSTHFT